MRDDNNCLKRATVQVHIRIVFFALRHGRGFFFHFPVELFCELTWVGVKYSGAGSVLLAKWNCWNCKRNGMGSCTKSKPANVSQLGPGTGGEKLKSRKMWNKWQHNTTKCKLYDEYNCNCSTLSRGFGYAEKNSKMKIQRKSFHFVGCASDNSYRMFIWWERVHVSRLYFRCDGVFVIPSPGQPNTIEVGIFKWVREYMQWSERELFFSFPVFAPI